MVLSSSYERVLRNSIPDLYSLANLVDLAIVLPFGCHSQADIYLATMIRYCSDLLGLFSLSCYVSRGIASLILILGQFI